MINMFDKMKYLHVSHFHTFHGKMRAPNEANHEDSTNHIFGHVDNEKSNSADFTSVGLKHMLSSVSLRIFDKFCAD